MLFWETPPPFLLNVILAGMEAYSLGGCVRETETETESQRESQRVLLSPPLLRDKRWACRPAIQVPFKTTPSARRATLPEAEPLCEWGVRMGGILGVSPAPPGWGHRPRL